jgi:uncharacterized protein DUF932
MSEPKSAGASSSIAQSTQSAQSTYNEELVMAEQDYVDVRSVLEGVQAVDLPFDFKRTDDTWNDAYGITSVPLLVRAANGTLYDDRRLKGIFVDGKYKRIVSRMYVVFPNEKVYELIKILAEQQGLEIRNTHESHGGDAKYWEVLDTDMQYSVTNNDQMLVGCVVRNSLGAGVALGADSFTYRLICSNGAIARGADLGSVAIKHLGTHEQMLDTFRDSITTMVSRSVQLLDVYRKATEIKMNLKIAEDFLKYVPERALPSCIEYEKKKGKVMSVNLSRRDTLWESFNDVTKSAWHYNKSGWLTKSGVLQRAHWVLMHATNGVAAA